MVLACALSLGACGGAHRGLAGTRNAGTVSGLSVASGEPAYSVAWLQNATGQTVTLESATILALRGFQTPKLVGVAIERTGSTYRGVMVGGAGAGWPASGLRVTRFSGHRLRSGGATPHHTALIVFGAVASATGEYAAAGVNVVVRKNGRRVTVHAIGPLAFCVFPKHHVRHCPTSFIDRAENASIGLERG